MTLKATYIKHISEFITPGGTSRGVLSTKDSYILTVWNDENPTVKGIGEISIIEKLSVDAVDNLEDVVAFVSDNISFFADNYKSLLSGFPAVAFGVEMALLDLKNSGKKLYFPSNFTNGTDQITINGLIWMGDIDFMLLQIREKLAQHYRCLKLKIGANDFASEMNLLKAIRDEFTEDVLEIRLDANGAFDINNALNKLNKLVVFGIHSIEQPIKAGNWFELAKLCTSSPIKIALDEELIGVTNRVAQKQLLETINPAYIILKPSLLGGFNECEHWIKLSKEFGIDFWATSALETNIGLNAIAQWSYLNNSGMPQGLGTGKLFTNNFESPLQLNGDQLGYKTSLTNG